MSRPLAHPDGPGARSRPLRVINLFAAPGVGKSALAGRVFGLAKAAHISIDHVTEHAKELSKTRAKWVLVQDQLKVFAEQHHRQMASELAGYEWLVTDSPLQLSKFYCNQPYFASFPALVDDAWQCFENYNFLLYRDMEKSPFEREGREHDLEGSLEVGRRMPQWLRDHGVDLTLIDLDRQGATDVLQRVLPDVDWKAVNAALPA
jgi:hypothetical protein